MSDGENKAGGKVERGWFANKIRSRKLQFVRQMEEEGVSLAAILGSTVLGTGNSKCKDLVMGTNLMCVRNSSEGHGAVD